MITMTNLLQILVMNLRQMITVHLSAPLMEYHQLIQLAPMMMRLMTIMMKAILTMITPVQVKLMDLLKQVHLQAHMMQVLHLSVHLMEFLQLNL